jgi:hypothetical protein
MNEKDALAHFCRQRPMNDVPCDSNHYRGRVGDKPFRTTRSERTVRFFLFARQHKHREAERLKGEEK